MKILHLIQKLLGIATDIADETGKGGKVKDILDEGRDLGWWEETPNGKIWRTGKKPADEQLH